MHAKWSGREDDSIVHYPLGQQTRADGGYLLHALGPVLEELERRGYDKRTFRFSIEPQAGNGRFASQR